MRVTINSPTIQYQEDRSGTLAGKNVKTVETLSKEQLSGRYKKVKRVLEVIAVISAIAFFITLAVAPPASILFAGLFYASLSLMCSSSLAGLFCSHKAKQLEQ